LIHERQHNQLWGGTLLYFRLLAIVAAIVGLAWACAKPGWDSISAALAACAALFGAFLTQPPKPGNHQQQNVNKGGIGIQAGRDARVGDINLNNDTNAQ